MIVHTSLISPATATKLYFLSCSMHIHVAVVKGFKWKFQENLLKFIFVICTAHPAHSIETVQCQCTLQGLNDIKECLAKYHNANYFSKRFFRLVKRDPAKMNKDLGSRTRGRYCSLREKRKAMTETGQVFFIQVSHGTNVRFREAVLSPSLVTSLTLASSLLRVPPSFSLCPLRLPLGLDHCTQAQIRSLADITNSSLHITLALISRDMTTQTKTMRMVQRVSGVLRTRPRSSGGQWPVLCVCRVETGEEEGGCCH